MVSKVFFFSIYRRAKRSPALSVNAHWKFSSYLEKHMLGQKKKMFRVVQCNVLHVNRSKMTVDLRLFFQFSRRRLSDRWTELQDSQPQPVRQRRDEDFWARWVRAMLKAATADICRAELQDRHGEADNSSWTQERISRVVAKWYRGLSEGEVGLSLS